MFCHNSERSPIKEKEHELLKKELVVQQQQQKHHTIQDSQIQQNLNLCDIMVAAIGSNDVLCGRGGATNNHPGNKRFRTIVADYMPDYLVARKKEKAIIARRIVDQIKGMGGRFLKRSDGNNTWIEVSDKKATEKTSQALREGLDVRHRTYRPEKMARRDSDSSNENPRKRTRLVTGRVIDSPVRVGYCGSSDASPVDHRDYSNMPELKPEDYSTGKVQNSPVDRLMAYFEPPRITRADCNYVEGV